MDVAVAVVVAVAVATTSATNKTWFLNVLSFYVLLFFFIYSFTENSKSGCELKIAYNRGHAWPIWFEDRY